jgi:DNA-binding NtrC family response regulator
MVEVEAARGSVPDDAELAGPFWRVLVVEDEGAVALHLEQSLRELGHEVVSVVATEAEAVACLRDSRPDLLITDIRLGRGGSGLRVAEQAQSVYGLPAVIITGASDGETYLRAEAVGAVAFLRKPFGLSQLRNLFTHIGRA